MFFVRNPRKINQMKRTVGLLCVSVVTWGAIQVATAQDQGPGGREGGPPPLVAALDTNRDGVITADEIAAAPQSLARLDKNSDGQLTPEELRPPMPGNREGGPGGPQGDRGPGGERGPMMNAEETVARWMSFDRNGDGQLTPQEVPGQLHSLITRADQNSDGVVTRDELNAACQQEGGGNQGRPQGMGRPPQGEGRPPQGEGRPQGNGGPQGEGRPPRPPR